MNASPEVVQNECQFRSSEQWLYASSGDSGQWLYASLEIDFELSGLADQWQYARSKVKLKIISYSKNDNSAHIPGI